MKASIKVPIEDVFNLRFIIKRIKEDTAPGKIWHNVNTHVYDSELPAIERLSNALDEAYKVVLKKGYR